MNSHFLAFFLNPSNSKLSKGFSLRFKKVFSFVEPLPLPLVEDAAIPFLALLVLALAIRLNVGGMM